MRSCSKNPSEPEHLRPSRQRLLKFVASVRRAACDALFRPLSVVRFQVLYFVGTKVQSRVQLRDLSKWRCLAMAAGEEAVAVPLGVETTAAFYVMHGASLLRRVAVPLPDRLGRETERGRVQPAG
jgi:hypothetical protein